MEIVQIKSKFLRNIFDQNTYVLKQNGEAIIIDAGAELEDILKETENHRVIAVLMTHLHFDHLWNIEKYIEKFDCDVFIEKGAEEKLSNPEHNASNILRRKMTFDVAKEKIKFYSDLMNIGSFSIKVIKTPGHSSDSVCLLIEKSLFSGDTVFDGATGRTDLYDGDNRQMIESLENLKKLDFDKVYPGHYSTTTKEKILSELG